MDALISLSGNIGTDVEFQDGEGWSYARFRLACTPRFLKQGEWTDGETPWVTVRCTNRTAINVRDSLKKGDPVLVSGKLRTHVWQNSEGERQDRLVVEAVSLGHDLTRGTSVFQRPARTDQTENGAEATGALQDGAKPEPEPVAAALG